MKKISFFFTAMAASLLFVFISYSKEKVISSAPSVNVPVAASMNNGSQYKTQPVYDMPELTLGKNVHR